MFTVYVRYSEKARKRYVGHTNDLERRLSEHSDLSTGTRGRFTLKNGPWRVIHREDGFESRSEAMRREKFLKSGQGREDLKRVVHV